MRRRVDAGAMTTQAIPAAQADPEPLFAHVEIYLGGTQPCALELIEGTVAALERASEESGAQMFLARVEGCLTEEQLIQLIRRMVTVI
jgi:hypothetical protein